MPCVCRISPVQLADSGIYTCVARSRAGLAELNFDVQVQGTNSPSPVDAYTTDLKELYLCVLISVLEVDRL